MRFKFDKIKKFFTPAEIDHHNKETERPEYIRDKTYGQIMDQMKIT